MPYRWRCCKCDNGWMTVQADQNICTWSECQHVKCNGCDQRNMAAPLHSGGDITIGGGGGRGIGGFAGGGGDCGHLTSAPHAGTEYGGDGQGSRASRCSHSTALDLSSLIPPPTYDDEDDDFRHLSPEDEDGLVPQPS
ncbi:hypothetical protein C7212DRAFT_348921 [Tuber magnatum]|uniref:Uncharacterized protein n=1 Tax=Tuber magnatum TaxID=42249 RepID=A0A317SFV6_9PEZI|nr:hypothetical protein C7212DRAFT_348921 [Tuber magnatum]